MSKTCIDEENKIVTTILSDIELNLAILHNDGKLEFSDNEGDDNFADCY